MERQLTHAAYGHVLTNVNVWSRDSRWIVYDVRSAAGEQFDGARIERVHVATGEVEVLYESQRGACCGVATFSPIDDRVAFILGPEDPTPDWHYAAYHRRGVIVDARRPGVLTNIDACDVAAPFTPGALRGGSHVHVFSGDGQWISFTYEDHVLATSREASAAEAGSSTSDLNQRGVAVAGPGGPVHPPATHPRNHPGEFFSVLATETVNQPRPGSNDISRAYEDAWVGLHGYRRLSGFWQFPALAFLGDVTNDRGETVTELFLVDLPHDVRDAGSGPLEGTVERRPAPPAGTQQRRLTFSADRAYPGVQGPRYWPRSSPDGARIGFLMRDDEGLVQIWTVSPNGGPPRQLTSDPFAVASAFTWDPLGRRIAYIADGSVMVVDAQSGISSRVTDPASGGEDLRPEACVFSPDGARIAFVRQSSEAGRPYNQIFVADAP